MANLTPLSPKEHASKNFKPRDKYLFTKDEKFAPIILTEIPNLLGNYLLAFLQEDESFLPIAILGDGTKNLYVNQEGLWLNSYVPSSFRGFPFAIAQDQNQNKLLCIFDEHLSDDPSDAPLFEEKGSLSSQANEYLNFLQLCDKAKQDTLKAAKALADANILCPWELIISTPDEKKLAINGLYRLDEIALSKVSPEQMIQLRNTGALGLAYAQLFSQNSHAKITELLKYHTEHSGAKELTQEDIERVFGADTGLLGF